MIKSFDLQYDLAAGYKVNAWSYSDITQDSRHVHIGRTGGVEKLVIVVETVIDDSSRYFSTQFKM